MRSTAALGARPFTRVELVVGRLQIAFAGAFPFVGVGQALAFSPADFGGLACLHPDDRVGARDVGKLELVDADCGVFRLLRGGVVERREILAAADLFETGILVVHVLAAPASPGILQA